jgi:hypothetical protein
MTADLNLVTLARSLCFGPPRAIVCRECREVQGECRCDERDFTQTRLCSICDAEFDGKGRYCGDCLVRYGWRPSAEQERQEAREG